MRKIISKKENEKKTRRNQLIIGLVLVAIMLFSILGYSLGSNPDNSEAKIEYNGLEFVQTNGLWTATLGSIQFSFLYNPREAMNANTTVNLLNNYVNKPLYLYSENPEAENEVSRNLFYNAQIVQRIQKACLSGEACNQDFPAKNCSENFIIIRNSNETKITQQENCVFIEGNNAVLTRLTDGFLYKILGIQ